MYNNVQKAMYIALATVGRWEPGEIETTPVDETTLDVTYEGGDEDLGAEEDELFIRARASLNNGQPEIAVGVERNGEQFSHVAAFPRTVAGLTREIYTTLEQAGAVSGRRRHRRHVGMGVGTRRRPWNGCPVCGGAPRPTHRTLSGFPVEQCERCGASIATTRRPQPRRIVSGPPTEAGDLSAAQQLSEGLTLDEAKLLLTHAIKSRTPVILWGSPGIGKTAIVNDVAQDLGKDLVTLVLSIYEPQDVGGIPKPVEMETRPRTKAGQKKAAGRKQEFFDYLPPRWIEDLGDTGILFLDELTTASPSTQAAALRILGERVVGFKELPENVAVIAAANPVAEAAVGEALAPPLANRLIHIKWPTPSPTEWGAWVRKRMDLKPGTLLDNIVQGITAGAPQVFLMYPGRVADAPTDKGWASPRMWYRALQALDEYYGPQYKGPLDKIGKALIGGAVGDDQAIAIDAYLNRPVTAEDVLAGRKVPQGKAIQLFIGMGEMITGDPDNLELRKKVVRRIGEAAENENLREEASSFLTKKGPDGTLWAQTLLNTIKTSKPDATTEMLVIFQEYPTLLEVLKSTSRVKGKSD